MILQNSSVMKDGRHGDLPSNIWPVVTKQKQIQQQH